MGRNKGLATVCLVFILLGCTPAQSMQAVKISTIRPAPTGLEQKELTIRRSDYDKALESSRGPANLRVVPMVVSASQAPATPEYRLFNIRKGSVGEILGLENADVLVAAHDYVVQNPNQFYEYLSAIRAEKASQIEVRRGEQPILIKITLTD